MKNPTLAVMPMQNMTLADLQERYRYFGRRAKTLCGVGLDGKPLSETLSAFFDKLATGINDPESMRLRAEFMAKVQVDPEARRQFCALRLETYNNYLFAELHWISYYFNIVTLKDDERPLEQNDYDKEIKFYFVGADGRPKNQKLFKDPVENLLPLRTLSSPVMRYKVNDIYRGNIVDQAVKTLTLARDCAQRMESECFQLVKTIFGPFSFTGPKANWPFVANSYIDTRNLPTSNNIPVFGANGYFDYATLDEIINYAKLINGVRSAMVNVGEFRPTGRVRVASSQIRFFGTFAAGSSTPGTATPAAAAPASAAEGMFEKGWGGVFYKGIQWSFEPDATLDPTENVVYPEFTVKPGRVWFKPSQDREAVRTGQQDATLFQNNEEERQMSKVFAASINSATRIFAARFDYTKV